jgi:AcrR family transcriptional regulator
MPTASSFQEPRAGRPRDVRLDEAIVQATIDLIAERGFGELTFAAIADRSGTTTPAIYRRWSSKADLVLHAVFRTEGPDVVADTGDLEEDLRTMIRWTLEKFGRPIGRAALAGLLSEPLGERSEKLAQLGVVWTRIGGRLARAISAGEIRPDVDTEAVIGVTAGAAMLVALLHGEEAIDEARVDSLLSLVMDGVRPRSGSAARPSTGVGR